MSIYPRIFIVCVVLLSLFGVGVVRNSAHAAQTIQNSTVIDAAHADAGSVTQVYQSASGFVVPASGTSGIASPYPGQITVSQPENIIRDVNITLQGISHTYPDDLNIGLVSPAGTAVLLIANRCGATDLNSVTLTFDESAASRLPDNRACASGTYRTSRTEANSAVFPAPAPTNRPARSLDAFNGENPNGTWQLFIVDDATQDTGTIAGWSLEITAESGFVIAPDETVGPLSPYPGIVNITGEVDPIADLNVTLSGMIHTFPADLDILLVSPAGTAVLLMSDRCGFLDVNSITLTFDDEAVAPLPTTLRCTTGTYQPSNSGVDDTFPAPAPAGPYASTLNAFDGEDANGFWQLFILDDEAGDTGTIAGWSLDITPDVDSVAPVVTVPDNQIYPLDAGQNTAIVTYMVTAIDDRDGVLPPTCAPASGTVFAVGTTTVNCTAVDMAGNTGNASFTVTVTDTYGSEFVLQDGVSATTGCGAFEPSVTFDLVGLQPDLAYTVVVAVADAANPTTPSNIMMWREFTVPPGHPSQLAFSAVLYDISDFSTLLDDQNLPQYMTAPFNAQNVIVMLSLYNPDNSDWINGNAVQYDCATGTVTPIDAFFGLRSAVCYTVGVDLGVPLECTLSES